MILMKRIMYPAKARRSCVGGVRERDVTTRTSNRDVIEMRLGNVVVCCGQSRLPSKKAPRRRRQRSRPTWTRLACCAGDPWVQQAFDPFCPWPSWW